MGCESDCRSFPQVIRCGKQESTKRKLHMWSPYKTKNDEYLSDSLDSGDADLFQNSRHSKDSFKRKKQWNWLKFSLPKPFHEDSKKRPIRRPSFLRYSFQSSTEKTEDVSSEFFVSTSDMPEETILFSPLLEEPNETTLLDVLDISLDLDESETFNEDSTETEFETNDCNPPVLERMDEIESSQNMLEKRELLQPLESTAIKEKPIEKYLPSQTTWKSTELKRPLHLSLNKMDRIEDLTTLRRSPYLFDRTKELDQLNLVGFKKWHSSMPTICEEKSTEVMSTRVEQRTAIMLKSDALLLPEQKRVERRNEIVVPRNERKPIPSKPKRMKGIRWAPTPSNEPKPLLPRRKRMKRRNAIIIHSDELEQFQPKKMERRNAIVIHTDTWELSRPRSNRMKRRNAIIIHNDQLNHPKPNRSDECKLVQSKSNRKKRNSSGSRSKESRKKRPSIIIRNLPSNQTVVECRRKLPFGNGFLVVSGVMVTVVLATLPMLSWLVMHLDIPLSLS